MNEPHIHSHAHSVDSPTSTDAVLDDSMSENDWQQLLAELETEDPDQFVFKSSDYPTEDAAMKALEALLREAMEEGTRAARDALFDTTRT